MSPIAVSYVARKEDLLKSITDLSTLSVIAIYDDGSAVPTSLTAPVMAISRHKVKAGAFVVFTDGGKRELTIYVL
jgi:hypothetical protein